MCVAPFCSYKYDDSEEHATRGYHVPRGEPYLLLHVHYGAERDERSNVDEEIKPENNVSMFQAGVALSESDTNNVCKLKRFRKSHLTF